MVEGWRAIEALADGTRRRILETLRIGPSSVGGIAAGMPVSQPAVSQHLAVLRKAGLVETEREGRSHFYRLNRAGFIAARAYLDGFWDDVLNAYVEAAQTIGEVDRDNG